MITVYMFDSNKIYLSARSVDEFSELPWNSTLVAPPSVTGTQILQWVGNVWVVMPDLEAVPPPPVIVPEFISTWQARAILITEGLIDAVYAFFNTLPSPDKELAISKFEHSGTVRRDDALVKMVIPQLGRSEAEIDAMFVAGDKLV